MTSKMLHVKAYVPDCELLYLTDLLFEKGLCQLRTSKMETLDVNLDKISEAKQKIEKVVNLLEEFKPIIPKKVNKKKIMELGGESKYIKQTEDIVNEFLPVIGCKIEELDLCNKKIKKNTELILTLENFPNVNLKLLESTKNFRIITGYVLNQKIHEINSQLTMPLKHYKKIDEKRSLLIIISLKSNNNVEQILHEIGIEIVTVPFQSTPKEIIKTINEENKQHRKTIKANKQLLKTIAENNMQNFEILSEEIVLLEKKTKESKKIGKSNSFVQIEAWVPQKHYLEFKNTLGICKDFVIESEEPDDAPTLLDNPKIFQPFELITNLYSAPKYKHFDPTILLTISFSLFFGFMLTDAVYGALLTVIAIMMFNKVHNKEVKAFSGVLIWCGISATLLGILFGSYFGNFFQELGFTIPALIDPMKDIITMLTISVSAGVIHMTIGLIIGLFQNLRRKRIKQGIKDQGVWIFFVLSVSFLLLQKTTTGLALLAISITLQVILNILESGLVMGIISIFNFSGFLGDAFSYARLMALAIGTAGIALAFNFMAILVKETIPIIGIVLAIIIFIVGHAFNMIMNGLGAFIHTLRLEFLEHFSKYYEGNGKLYKPFLAERRKTEVKI